MAAADPHPANPVQEATSLWLARLERGLREEEGPALREWLKNAANRGSILDASRLWHGPEIYAVVASLVPPKELLPERPHRNVYKICVGAGLAASLVMLGITAALGVTPWSYMQGNRPSRYEMPAGLYSTAIGETQKVTISDGSEITLNTSSSIVVSYSPSSRDVFLRYGEATFDVAPDEKRPFKVNAGRRIFEAVGTRFNVRVMPQNMVSITVAEGAVKLLYATPKLPDDPALRRTTLSYGEALLGEFDAADVGPHFQMVSRLEPDEAQARVAWQRGLIVFESRTLPDVLDEVDRYTRTRFVLGDERLRYVRIAGQFRTGDVDGLLRTLREKFSIASRRDAQGRVVLTPLQALGS
jgi:transmembrane sensor